MTTGPKTCDPVGHCIYCGGTDRPSNLLSDEHIVSYAVNGNLVLPKSSCGECRLIIEQFEVRVLRGPMRAVRAIRKLRTRNPGISGTRLIALTVLHQR
jgi:hypothetical protein